MHQTRSRSLLVLLPLCSLALWGALVLASLSSAPTLPTPARVLTYTTLLTSVASVQERSNPFAATLPCCQQPAPPPGPPFSLAQCPTGTQFASCQDALSVLSGWTSWVLLAIGAGGVLSILAVFYQVVGTSGGTRGPAAWQLIFQRVISACVVFFVAWRLTPIAMLVETTLAAHTGDSTSGRNPLPTGAIGELVGLLLGILIQVLLAWGMLRLTLRILEGIAAIGGQDARALGTTLRSVGFLVVLGVLILATPTFIGWLAGLLTSGSL